MKKLLFALLLLSACASKIIVKDCMKVEGDAGLEVCSRY